MDWCPTASGGSRPAPRVVRSGSASEQAVLGLSAIDQMFFIPAYPFWSLTIIAMDVVALYGLCAYGSRAEPAKPPEDANPLRLHTDTIAAPGGAEPSCRFAGGSRSERWRWCHRCCGWCTAAALADGQRHAGVAGGVGGYVRHAPGRADAEHAVLVGGTSE